MSEKIIKLAQDERIVAVVPGRGSWAGDVVWVYISNGNGDIRFESILHDEMPLTLRALLIPGMAMCYALKRAVLTHRTNRQEPTTQSAPKTNKREEAMASALRVMHTWASVDGALDPENVRALAKKALAGEK